MALAQQAGDGEFWSSVLDPSSLSDLTSPIPGTRKPVWTPAVDLYLTADEMIVWAELPGVSKADLHVSVTRDSLILRGFKQTVVSGVQPVMAERFSGSFERSVRLPQPVEADSVAAKLEDGVLLVRLRTSSAREAKVTVE
jgi:HSP20 family protein